MNLMSVAHLRGAHDVWDSGQPPERIAASPELARMLETAALATSRGARVVAIGSIIDRTAGRDPFDVPFRSLLQLNLQSYAPAGCPVCRVGGQPPEKPGSRPQAEAGTAEAGSGAARTT